MDERVVIERYSYRHQAEIAKSVLASEGIEATVDSDDCGAVDPALQFVRGVRLYVAPDDEERARTVLADQVDTHPANGDADDA